MQGRGYKSPCGRYDCTIFLCSNFPGLTIEDNVRKRPFETGPTNGLVVSFSNKILTRSAIQSPLLRAAFALIGQRIGSKFMKILNKSKENK